MSVRFPDPNTVRFCMMRRDMVAAVNNSSRFLHVVGVPLLESPQHRIGAYQVLERLAIGGMAEVFKARKHGEHGFEKLVAIKKILPHLASNRASVEMFLDEARITASLEHPHIVQAFELGHDADSLYFAMEYVDGLDVLALLQHCARTQIRLPATLAALIARDVLDALDYAHEARDTSNRPLHIVHRDISPSNVLVSWNGHVKLTDFGVAIAASRRHQTEHDTLRGKYGYMSPEQVGGAKVDGRSDVFSVGIVLAEMIMARRLFHGPTDLDILLAVRDVKLDRLDANAREFPADLLGIVVRALQSTPADRWQSAGEMRDALDAWLANHPKITSRELAGFISQVARAQTAAIVTGAYPVVRAVPAPVVVVDRTDELELVDLGDELRAATSTSEISSTPPTPSRSSTTMMTCSTPSPRAACRTSTRSTTTSSRSRTAPPARWISAELTALADQHCAPLRGAARSDEARPCDAAIPKQVVVTLPRRKKQHTMETAIASLFEESQILALPRSRAPRGTGRFPTPTPRADSPIELVTRRADAALVTRRADSALELVGTPMPMPRRAERSAILPLSPSPALTPAPALVLPARARRIAMQPMIARPPTATPPPELRPAIIHDLPLERDDTPLPRTPTRAGTSLSGAHLLPKAGKLGRLHSIGKTGAFQNYSDAVVEAPVDERSAPHAAAQALAPDVIARLTSPLGVLCMLTIAMFGVFLLAMYGVI